MCKVPGFWFKCFFSLLLSKDEARTAGFKCLGFWVSAFLGLGMFLHLRVWGFWFLRFWTFLGFVRKVSVFMCFGLGFLGCCVFGRFWV